jgi:hypothetical protein
MDVNGRRAGVVLKTGNVVVGGCSEGSKSLAGAVGDGGEGSVGFATLVKAEDAKPCVCKVFKTVSQPCSRDLTLDDGLIRQMAGGMG